MKKLLLLFILVFSLAACDSGGDDYFDGGTRTPIKVDDVEDEETTFDLNYSDFAFVTNYDNALIQSEDIYLLYFWLFVHLIV